MLSLEMNLPIYYIDTMQYKNNLSEADKNYITFHSIMSYLGISTTDLLQTDIDYAKIYEIINTYKEQIAEVFLTLKKNGNLTKDNMCQIMSNIVDISKTNVKSK